MRTLRIIFFILSTVGVGYTYLALRLGTTLEMKLLLLVPFLFMLSFPLGKPSLFRLYFIYTSMGLLTYLLVFSLLRDLSLLTSYPLSVQMVWVLSFGALLIGLIWASLGPRVKKVVVPLYDLPPSLEGLTVAQISDLHIGPTIGQRYVRDVVKKVNALNPDLIALTGDIGDGPVKMYRSAIGELQKLSPKFGSFYVPGNHEYYWNVNEWMNVINNVGIVVLVNRGKIVQKDGGRILMAGIPDVVSPVIPSPEETLKWDTGSDLKILLSHRPDFSERASQAGYHLMLAGHTHAGQFFPWTIVVRFVHRYSKGLHQVGSMWTYVNSGTGSWGPLIRLGTTPEITLLTVRKKSFEGETPRISPSSKTI